MNQQVTYRVGRGVPSPAPDEPITLVGFLVDLTSKVAFMGLGLVAIVLTVGVNQYTPH